MQSQEGFPSSIGDGAHSQRPGGHRAAGTRGRMGQDGCSHLSLPMQEGCQEPDSVPGNV